MTRQISKPPKPRDLCANCVINAQTAGRCATDHPCLDPDAKVYGNCFNRVECDQLLKAETHEVINKVISSGCLSCNFTDEGRKIMEVRLRGISEYLRVVQPKYKSKENQRERRQQKR